MSSVETPQMAVPVKKFSQSRLTHFVNLFSGFIMNTSLMGSLATYAAMAVDRFMVPDLY